jgi:hypothetical protein
VAAALDLSDAPDALGLGERLSGVRRIVLVLVDGLGHHLLPRAAASAPLLAEVLAGHAGWSVDELACTFPSTTPTSLVSLGTGVLPGEHGVVGFTVNVPGTDRLLTHILWRDDPPSQQWQPVPTWYERMVAAGIDARVVLPAAFLGSGLTDAAYRGARACGVHPSDDYATRVIAEVESGPGLVFAYTSAIDTAAHLFGIASARWGEAAAEVDRLLRRITERLPGDAALLVTADHGGLDIPPVTRIDVALDRRLTDGVRVIAGEPRVRYVHARPGAEEDVYAAWREVLAGRATVLRRAAAIEAGLFGTVPDAHAARIGDVVAICGGETAILATDHEPPEVARLVGMHGSDSPAETAIPLITIRG